MVPKSQKGPGSMSFFQTAAGSHLPVEPAVDGRLPGAHVTGSGEVGDRFVVGQLLVQQHGVAAQARAEEDGRQDDAESEEETLAHTGAQYTRTAASAQARDAAGASASARPVAPTRRGPTASPPDHHVAGVLRRSIA